jgi:hypothetical protein
MLVEIMLESLEFVLQVVSFAKSSCTTLKGFLSPWRRFFGLGLHADSSIRENARRERGLSWPGFKKEFGSQKNSS